MATWNDFLPVTLTSGKLMDSQSIKWREPSRCILAYLELYYNLNYLNYTEIFSFERWNLWEGNLQDEGFHSSWFHHLKYMQMYNVSQSWTYNPLHMKPRVCSYTIPEVLVPSKTDVVITNTAHRGVLCSATRLLGVLLSCVKWFMG